MLNAYLKVCKSGIHFLKGLDFSLKYPEEGILAL